MKWKNIILTAALSLLPANRTSKKQYVSDEIAKIFQLQEIATNDPYITVKISDLEWTPLYGKKSMINGTTWGDLLWYDQAVSIMKQIGKDIKATDKVKPDDIIKMPLIYPELRKYLPNTWYELKQGAFKKYKEINDKDLVIVTKCKNGKHALAYYKYGKLVLATYVSIGTTNHPTPTWKYKLRHDQRDRRSKKYNNAAMPFAIWWMWDGYFIHQGQSDGTPKSHGCVRVGGVQVKYLYETIPENSTIIVDWIYKEPTKKKTP